MSDLDWDWVGRVAHLRERGEPFVLATVVNTEGSTPREAGARMLIVAGEIEGTIGGGQLENLVKLEAEKALVSGEAKLVRYPLGASAGQCCGGVVYVFLEPFGDGPTLYLFGAGHVGIAVTRVLEGTPFRVSLIDDRESWVHSPLVPSSVQRFHEEWDDFVRKATWDANRTYVAIMTYRHDVDQEIVEAVIQRPARFIGLIGSDTKWEKFQRRLLEKGSTAEQLKRVHCPIGLPIGGKAPQQVAISVAAQLLQTYNQSKPA